MCSYRFIQVQLCKPMGCSPPASSVHGILQARILEQAALPFSRGSLIYMFNWVKTQNMLMMLHGKYTKLCLFMSWQETSQLQAGVPESLGIPRLLGPPRGDHSRFFQS